MKRPMFMAALMALSGAAMSIYAKHYYAILVFILIVLIFLLMHKKYNLSYKYCIILIIFPITYFGTLEMKNKLIFENVIEAEGTYIENVTGKVISISDKQNYYVLELDSCEFSIDGTKSNKNGMLVYTDKNNIFENDIITMSGKIKVLDSARNWGEFDSRNYYLSKGIQYSFKASEINIKERQESGLGEFLRYVRKNVKEIYNKTFRGDNYGLICAMVLGDKNDLEEDIKNLYSKNGISHLLAVSGVKTLKLDIPLVPETRINWAFVPLHIAIIYILKLCLNEEIIPRCRFPCSRGYFTKCINWQKKQ
ncbi:MAG: ComEC family competence protein [Lachnospira sp.]|nr:ComEC family competence protein [Lachnospira sp.]